MESLWSMTTTIREAERIPAFLRTAKEIENEEWNRENQIIFQILLIKNREYLNTDGTQTFSKLNEEQVDLLKDKTIKMTYEQAKGIFDAKNYEDPAMRGRQSMSPLEKLGLVNKNSGKIILTDIGNKLLEGKIAFDEFMFEQLLKLQYPNPIEKEHTNWNSKPFINILKLIKKVNELCIKNKYKAKGLTKTEFGIFALSIDNYSKIDDIAYRVMEFRNIYESYSTFEEKEKYRKDFIKQYLSNYKNPEKNCSEYTDNIIRYMRITKYIYIRGKFGNACIDLEPRRIIEINSIIENDNGSAKQFSKEEWLKYYGTFGVYELPYENINKLKEILEENLNDINRLEKKLGLANLTFTINFTKEDLKKKINELREYRKKLQNLEIKYDYNKNLSKIDEAINALSNIKKLDMKPSIALEKWVNVALNIINDSLLIKPNSIVGDDNEPTFTAPSGVPDIECYYEDFNATCEVTMLESRDQWYNEGQPVMRHLRDFENFNINKTCYCLFIAPSLHRDTISTYYQSVKYEYEGKRQRIIPITINQLIKILNVVLKVKQANRIFRHNYLKQLFDGIVNSVLQTSSNLWVTEKIPEIINNWEKAILFD